ncbi:MAG: hypothetical protein M0R77_12760 [Gammaproteobacteria bacterium]|nr:hypothetical protein [Gammaproteobacteria bacterium]
MTYTAADFTWNGNAGQAINGQVYYDFLPRIVIDGTVFHFDYRVTDDDHWITEIHYKADDGRTVVAFKDMPEKVC